MNSSACSLKGFDLSQSCVRESLAVLLPVAYVALCLGVYILERLAPSFVAPFTQWLTVEEAHRISSKVEKEEHNTQITTYGVTSSIWIFISITETAVWVAIGSYNLYLGDLYAIRHFVFAATWLYATVKSGLETDSPPMQLMLLYAMHFIGSVFMVTGDVYFTAVYGSNIPGGSELLGQGANIVATAILVLCSLSSQLNPQTSLDGGDRKGGNRSPEDSSTVWGWLTFQWLTPLLKEGTLRTLNEADVYDWGMNMQAWPLFSKFVALDPTSSMPWRLFRANSQDLILNFFGTIISVMCNYSTPFFLKLLLDEISLGYPDSRGRAYVYAFLIFAFKFTKSEIDMQRLWCERRAAIRIRSELMSSISLKALKRKDVKLTAGKKGTKGANSADTGKVMNIMSQDTGRISTAIGSMSLLYSAPLEITIAIIFLWKLLGIAVLAGLAVVVLTWPLNTILAHQSFRIKKNQLAARDRRMNILNELLTAIKLVKFFAWEEQWADRVLEARSLELVILVQARCLKILLELLWNAVPIAISTLTFYAYVAQGNQLTVGTTFAALSLFGMLRGPLSATSERFMEMVQAYASLKRIDEFLREEEVDRPVSSLMTYEEEAMSKGITLEKASFTWNNCKAMEPRVDDVGQASHEFRLLDITISFPHDKLSVVTGPTASGKTALLLSLLGEMTTLPNSAVIPMLKNASGKNGFTPSISYAAQTSWLQNQSIKDNILFGSEFDEERYNAVVEACALIPDFRIFEDGDETEIGTRGVTLSGGQKARVALARAVYAKTKVVLLDDPLSAVDAHTAKSLVELLFMGSLMQNRTVILVTHHLELVLPAAAYIVHLKDGRIETQGPVEKLRTSSSLIDIVSDCEPTSEGALLTDEPLTATEGQSSGDSKLPLKAVSSTDASASKNTPRKLVKDEHRDEGRVKWTIYKAYVAATAGWPFAAAVLFILLLQSLRVFEKFWIKIWAESYEKGSGVFQISQAYQKSVFTTGLFTLYLPSSGYHFENRLPSANDDPFFFVGVYALIGIVSLLAIVLVSSMTYIGAYIASKRLFEELLGSVTQATMHWYDITPVGRIMNRFSKDIDKLDGGLAGSMKQVATSSVGLLVSVAVVVSVFPVFIIPAVVIGYMYYKIGVAYLETGRDIRRMESTSRSPVFAFFGELLDGVVTVRAFSAETMFLETLCKKVDLTLKMHYTYWNLNRWLLLRFDCLGTVAILLTSILSISSKSNGMAGWAALGITSALTFTHSVYWACRNWTACELDFNSAERIFEYVTDIPHEQAGVIENARPPAHWPSSSSPNAHQLLQVQNLEIKYAPDLPSVLHGVTFALKAGERVGILGRTGSGKSTLAMSFLRFVEPTSGRILIDGIDLTKIGVRDLRSRVSFVPQDAVLFAGTIRENLNPFGEYDDAMCWDALKRVHLVTEASSLPPISGGNDVSSGASETSRPGKAVAALTLDSEVSAGGQNFSVGQRQLLAMARAILRRSTVVILDEATSSIDFKTDDIIQRTIREEFSNGLLISIAHRLNTIIDYDRLLVLDAGRLVEFDTPFSLISKEGGLFREFCLQSGNFEELEEIAKKKACDTP